MKLLSLIALLIGVTCVFGQYEQVMVALTGKPGEMVVSWVTFEATPQSVVIYSRSKTNLSLQANGSSVLFVDPQPKHTNRYIHTAILTNLAQNSFYYYKVGDGKTFSPILRFKTLPPGEKVVKMAVYGDFGDVNAQSLTSLTNSVERHDLDMILHVGDMAYDLHTDNGTIGDAFLNAIQPFSSSVPYMGCLGNHEGKYNFSHYNYRFKLWEELGKNSGSGANNWFFSWEFVSGSSLVHMVSISTEVYYVYVDENTPPDLTKQRIEQYNWLHKDLSEARKRGVDWIIVYGHRPMYCSNVDDLPDCSTDAETLRLGINFTDYGMEKILGQYNVDIYFTAHEHSYERTFPVYEGEWENQENHTYVNPKKPVHIISGSAGCQEGFDYYDQVFYGPWSVVRSSTYGYGHLRIHNSTHLHWEQILDVDGSILDEFWIVRNK